MPSPASYVLTRNSKVSILPRCCELSRCCLRFASEWSASRRRSVGYRDARLWILDQVFAIFRAGLSTSAQSGANREHYTRGSGRSVRLTFCRLYGKTFACGWLGSLDPSKTHRVRKGTNRGCLHRCLEFLNHDRCTAGCNHRHCDGDCTFRHADKQPGIPRRAMIVWSCSGNRAHESRLPGGFSLRSSASELRNPVHCWCA